jgi:hypothetical protein
MTEPLDRRLRALGTRCTTDVTAFAPDLGDIGRRADRRRHRRVVVVSLAAVVVASLIGALALPAVRDEDTSVVQAGGAREEAHPPGTAAPGTAPPSTDSTDGTAPPCPPDQRSDAMPLSTTTAGLLALAASSCLAGPPPTVTPPTSTDPGPSTTATAPAAPVPAPAPTTTPPPPTPACGAADLALELKFLGVGGGHTHSLLVFTNTAAARCTMKGYPGVQFLTAAGMSATPVGFLAGSPPFVPPLVTLDPGSTAHAYMNESSAQNYSPPQCSQHIDTVTLRVYPPDATTALEVPYSTVKCPIVTTDIGVIYPGNSVVPGEPRGA